MDILVRDGIIAKIADRIEPTARMSVVNAEEKVVVPGLADVHVHLREPGFPTKETVRSGTLAAARGGFTTLCAMPNLNPAPDSIDHLNAELDIIRRDAVVKVIPYASITKGQRGEGEIVDFEALKPFVAAFSDDGRGVQDDRTMQRAMELAAAADVMIAAHCEVDSLVRGGYVHDGEYARRHNHAGISSESEWREVERDVELARLTGCRYHVCHVSTAESVEIIRRAKAAGVRVTCETAPHYLVLCDEDLREAGNFKMNPPLRSRADMEALRKGVADGTIDMIATDHAPHTVAEKSRGLRESLMGVVGLETALPVVYTNMVGGGIISAARMVELMSVAPRRIFGLGGGIAEGRPADLAVLDLKSEYDIDPSTFLSQGRSTPFEGMRVRGECVLTLVDGRVAYRKERLIL